MSARAKQLQKAATKTRSRIGNIEPSASPEPKSVSKSRAKSNNKNEITNIPAAPPAPKGRGAASKKVQIEQQKPKRTTSQPRGKGEKVQSKPPARKAQPVEILPGKRKAAKIQKVAEQKPEPEVVVVEETKSKRVKNNQSQAVKVVPPARASNPVKPQKEEKQKQTKKDLTPIVQRQETSKAIAEAKLLAEKVEKKALSQQTENQQKGSAKSKEQNEKIIVVENLGKRNSNSKTKNSDPIVVQETKSKKVGRGENLQKSLSTQTVQIIETQTPPSPAPSPVIQENKRGRQPAKGKEIEENQIPTSSSQIQSKKQETLLILKQLQDQLFESPSNYSQKNNDSTKNLQKSVTKEEKKETAITKNVIELDQEESASSPKVTQRGSQSSKDTDKIEVVNIEEQPVKKRGRQPKNESQSPIQEAQSKGNLQKESKQLDEVSSIEVEQVKQVNTQKPKADNTISQIDGRIISLQQPPSIVQNQQQELPPPGTLRHLIHDVSFLLEQASEISRNMTEHVDKVDRIQF